MSIALEVIVKGNMKRSGYVMNVDALALDDRMIELQGVVAAIDNTVTKFSTEAKEMLAADVGNNVKRGALTELLEMNDEIPQAIDSIESVFVESMFFKSPERVAELARQRKRFNTLVNKINKHLDTNK